MSMCFCLKKIDAAKPHALDTFLEEMAELGIIENLIKNKKLPSYLLEK